MQIMHYERDHEVLQRAAEHGSNAEGVEGIYYQTLVGQTPGMPATKQQAVLSGLIPGSSESTVAGNSKGVCCCLTPCP